MGDTLNNFSSQFREFFTSAITDSDNLGESFKRLATGIGTTMVSAIGKMIAQWLVYKATKAIVDKATKAAAVPALTAHAQAASLLAGINAYASAAAIPIVGFGMAPGAMAAALAATQPMAAAVAALALAGMAHDGMDSIPETGTWLLKRGERVVTSQTSKKLDATLNRLQNNYNTSTTNNMYKNGSIYSGESHYHYHSHGPVFLNRAQMRDAAKMLMKETDRERTRIGAVN